MLLFCIGNAFASDVVDLNSTVGQDNPEIDDSSVISADSSEIEVKDWEDIQYYASLSDKNYVLKLKENTNYYPKHASSSDDQIIFNNNVTIIGSQGAYIGDSSPNPRNITYTAMKVPDNNGIGITFKGVTFKWIASRYQPDGLFMVMGGNAVNYFEDCYFTDISTTLGHSAILHIKLGDMVMTNCTFINCTNDFGCISVYNPDDDPTTVCTRARLNVTDSYFEGNYGRTAPGAINNCGILVVRNSTFYKNSAFWWAGAVHTTGGANTTVYDSLFLDNVAGWNGGAMYTYSYLQIYNTTFLNNNCTTSNGGGAIGACKHIHAPFIYVQDSLFQNNENTCWSLSELSSGTGRGGAISIMDEGGIEVRNTTFIKNSASLGTAICAINAARYGSPYVILVGNRFINHTRVGDVLDIRLTDSSYCEIRDNYYYNNSFEFKKIRLLADEKVGDDVVIHIDAELKNPNSFESDILDTTLYDIYVDRVYNMTVVGRTFTLNLKDCKTCNVYAVPTISNAKTNEIFVGVPKEYVYVSQKRGDDGNDGLNRSTPVKTIEKAVEIAKTKGNIVIMDGTFEENGFSIDYNLNIIGENNVKFTGSCTDTLFTVMNSHDLSISNVAFEGLIFTTKATGIIRQASGFTVVENCRFNSNHVSGLTGTNLIEAKNIEVYNSNFTNHNKDNVHVTLIKANEFLIDNCIFKDNVASHTSYKSLITTVSEKSGVKGTILDTIFESNTVKSGCIYFDANSKPLTITNTKFIANKVGSSNDVSSGIKIDNSPTVTIESSIFMNNVDLGDKSAVIHVSGSSASVYVLNSIILNNSYQNSFNMVFSASTSSNFIVYRNLDGNWWGNTWQDYSIVPPVAADACNNWLILNVTPNTTDLAINQKASLEIDLAHAVNRTNYIFFRDVGKLPKIELEMDAINGTLSSSKVNLVRGSANVEYKLQSLTRGSVTVHFNNVCATLLFNWALIDADIGIDVHDITYGNATEIAITAPDDIDESKMALIINNVSYSFNDKIAIPKLDAGEYLINLTYAGDSKYCEKSYVKLFSVEKASPQMGIDINDTYYGNPVRITVKTDEDVTGEIEIKLDDISDKKAISNGNVEFTVSNLQAGDYAVEVNYLGNENYLSRNLTSEFKVKKYDSTLVISKGNVEVGSDVTLTFTLNNEASGIITVNVNGKMENVTVSSGTATYTIKSISSGLYDILATYGGDAKYLTCRNSTQIDVGRLNSSLTVDVADITYGEDAVFTIVLNDGSSGNVTITIDGKDYAAEVNDGKATLNVSDLTAGDKVAEIKYSGDFTYLGFNTSKSFNVLKAKPSLTIDVDDIKEGKTLNVIIAITKGTTGTLRIVTPDGSENAEIPRTGLFTRVVSDLGIGSYSITAIYAGDENYLAVNLSETFSVTAWDDPQWPNEGYDIKNTESSPYPSDANGNVAWISNINASIIANMAIDSEGNIYIVTSEGIYSLKNTDGSINWIFKADEAGENFTGIAIGRDMILSPKSGYKLFFINQTTGAALNNNIFQGSSYFIPVVDENANIYITSEYQTKTSSYNLVIVPYGIWEFSTAPILIDIGKSAPTSAPVLINNNTVAVATVDGLRIIDVASKSVTNSFKVITHVRPVVSENIMYTIEGNSVVAITPDGSMWKVNINGTPGDYLSVGENGGIFSITKEGALYEYSTGEEVLIYDFKNNVSQAILVGQNDVLYVGCENGEFYSLDSEGNLLWKANLNESLSGKPVMDEKGVIYAISGNRIVAITNAGLKDSKVSANVDESSGSDVKVDIHVESEATGSISINVDGAYVNKSEIKNGQASFVISNLAPGNHSAKIAYAGDSRFKSGNAEVKFNILKGNVDYSVEASDIYYGEDLIINVSKLPVDASGTVTVDINGKQYSNVSSNGNATINVPGLPAGAYNAEVKYSNDDKYMADSKTLSVKVLKAEIPPSEEVLPQSDDLTSYSINLPSDATGTLTVIVDGEKYTADVVKGKANINIPELSGGSHNISVMYSGDDMYSPIVKSEIVNVLIIRLTGHDVSMLYTAGGYYKVCLTQDGSPLEGRTVTVNINGRNYPCTTCADGYASLKISLPPKTYTVTATYGNLKTSNKVVVKSIINANNVNAKKSAKSIKIKVSLKQVNKKYLKNKKITLKFNKKTFTAKTNKKGVATFTIKNSVYKKLKTGKKYTYQATYGKNTVKKNIIFKK
ncbi:Ig-like domain repeat protein [uncultured Methanobrevibacter sp.]|uniref:Ig-like domain repeat protein n=1 Tax=uncultured Methanobrevibacter sp. TaxID=253161 RepID=UPI00261F72A4|nr:Ig-like domain repeat protein [uncultured Methanobrevibacter sp.]